MIGGSNSINIYKEEVLKHYTQEELFIIAGFTVKEGLVRNPFREDKTPGCKFLYLEDTLLFSDFTGFFDKTCITCFEALEYKIIEVDKKKFKNINDICLNLIKNKTKYRKRFKNIGLNLNTSSNNSKGIISKTSSKHDIDLRIVYKYFKDSNNYFKQFDISIKTLKDENIYLVKEYYINSSYDKNLVVNRYHNPKTLLTIGYVFPNGHIKLYMPYADKNINIKFLGTSTCNDVYNIDKLDVSRPLLITKSIKDALVIKYHYYDNVVSLNSEKCLYLNISIVNYFSLFPKVYVLFDNDDTGIKMSQKICSLYNYTFISPELLEKDVSDNYLDANKRLHIITTLKPHFLLKNY
jgi:hypothetical protein